MVKHPETIRWQIAIDLFECVRSFCGIGAKRVNDLNFILCNNEFKQMGLNRLNKSHFG